MLFLIASFQHLCLNHLAILPMCGKSRIRTNEITENTFSFPICGERRNRTFDDCFTDNCFTFTENTVKFSVMRSNEIVFACLLNLAISPFILKNYNLCSGSGVRTHDLVVMSHTSYHCSTPQYKFRDSLFVMFVYTIQELNLRHQL